MSPSSSHQRHVLVGRVARAHGVRGELGVDFYGEAPEILRDAETLRLREEPPGARPEEVCDSAPGEPRRVEKWRLHHDRVLLKLQGVDDRDAADAMRGASLWLPADALPPPDEEEIFLHELLGVAVHLADGEYVGELAGFLETGHGQEVWILHAPPANDETTLASQGAEPSPAPREILFPAQPEFVEALDLDARRVIIAPPPGLLELYTEPQPEPKPKAPRRPRGGRRVSQRGAGPRKSS